MRTLASLIELSQAAVFWPLHFSILQLLISVCTVHSSTAYFLVALLVDFPGIIIKYLTYFSLNIHSINMINPIQTTYSDT